MNQPKKHSPPWGPQLAIGAVRLHSQGDYLVETEKDKYSARRAAGCLVSPAPGDLVLLAVNGPGRAWILNVLERAQAGPTVIHCPQGLAIDTGTQGLAVEGARLEMSATEEIKSTAPQWSLTAARGSVLAHDFSFLIQNISAKVGRLRWWAQVMESRAKRLIQRAGQAFRIVDGLDKHTAGKVRTEVRESWDLHSENTKIIASEKIRMDAEKIDLG